MNDKIAIDVVLLLPQEIIDEAIKVNSKLNNDQIVLNNKNCLPHISLCMGVVQKKDLPIVAKIIENIASDTQRLNSELTGIKDYTAFDIRNNIQLQKLHEMLMNKLSQYLTYDATVEMFYSSHLVEPKSLFWVNNYKDKFSFDNYYPHITLGVGKVEKKKMNLTFTASTVALCHIGNYCTCRKVLFTADLKK
ncbi:hypothetical protein J4232_02885 [Candidatus Woesearchaeota archaeon]|nr:hypothetical protein [Candidatus Woesearchaeota archaeon]